MSQAATTVTLCVDVIDPKGNVESKQLEVSNELFNRVSTGLKNAMDSCWVGTKTRQTLGKCRRAKNWGAAVTLLGTPLAFFVAGKLGYTRWWSAVPAVGGVMAATTGLAVTGAIVYRTEKTLSSPEGEQHFEEDAKDALRELYRRCEVQGMPWMIGMTSRRPIWGGTIPAWVYSGNEE